MVNNESVNSDSRILKCCNLEDDEECIKLLFNSTSIEVAIDNLMHLNSTEDNPLEISELLDDELLDLENTDVDDIFFNDFKQKLEEEQFLDEDNIENENDFSQLTLEDAVMDFNSGYEDAFDFIYDSYRKKLDRWGKRYNNEELGIELLDIVLLKAVQTFDRNAKTKFNTYFWKCARNYASCYKTHNDAQKRAHNKIMSSLQENVYKSDKGELGMEETLEDTKIRDDKNYDELKMAIYSMKDCLKPKEITALIRLVDDYTLQEIGEELGVTAAAICMLLKRLSKKQPIAKKLNEILRG